MGPKLFVQPRNYLLLALLFPFMASQAQRPHIGIKAGAVISNLSFRAVDPLVETSKKGSVTFGLFVHVPVNGRFSIRPSFEYVSKGARTKDNNFNGYSYQRKIVLSYFDIPLNFLHGIPAGKNKWLFGGGPVISFLLNKEENREFKGSDLGVNVLAMYEWAIGASLSLNFRQGLKNVVMANSNGATIKNYCFGFTIGYWF